MKKQEIRRCHWCGKEVRYWSVTIPRKAGDLVFDTWLCQEAWREGERIDALLLEE